MRHAPTSVVARLTLAALAALTLSLPACTKPDVRPYTWTDQHAAKQTLASRARSIRTVQAACALTLTDTAGESVNFDGALVVRLEDSQVWLRLRAWKLGAAVFDATARPDGLWLMVSDEAARRQGEGMQKLEPGAFTAAWKLFAGDFLADAGVIDNGGPQFQLVHLSESGQVIEADVDRATLTVSEYRISHEHSHRQRLILSEYREFGPDAIPFPLRITAISKTGTVEVRLENVELNGAVAEAAFTPPRRAVKQ